MASERMMPTTRLGLDVEVYVDDRWWPGVLEHWRQTAEGRWEGWVRWSTGPSETRIGWYDQDRVRKSSRASAE